MFSYRTLAVLPLLVIPVAFASETNTPDSATVVVTAMRTAQAAEAAFVPVRVVTGQGIEQSQAQPVEEFLRGRPGVSISTNGGRGRP